MTSRFLDRAMVLSFGTLVGAYVFALYNKNEENTKITQIVDNNSKNPLALFPKEQIITGNTNILSDLFRFGYPGPSTDLRCNESYVSSYNRALRIPNYVIEKITKESLSKNLATREKSEFKEDLNVPKKFRAFLEDYKRSGYDRGHLVPAANTKIDQKAMDETFLLTNITPQVGKGFNRNYWAYFERFCRSLVYEENIDELYIVTGGLFLPRKDPSFPDKNKYYVQYEVIGNPPNVAVPTHFYKILLGVNKKDEHYVQGFVLPNRHIPDEVDLKRFIVPIDAIERASGLEFFNKIKNNKVKELCSNINCKIQLPKLNSYNKKESIPSRL